MEDETDKEVVTKDDLASAVSAAVADALAAQEAEAEENLDGLTDEEVQVALDKKRKAEAELERT